MFKKQNLIKILTAFVIIALSLVLIYFVSTKDIATAQNGSTSSPYIELNNSIKVDSSSYYDGTKIFKLPSTVKDNEIISVIVQGEHEALYDAYTSAEYDDFLTFQEYLKTDHAQDIRNAISVENKALQGYLNGVSYEIGARYDTILSGFEILIKASDFETVARALDGKATTIVGEVYKTSETTLVENKVNVYETGIFNSSNFKYDGTGMTVAVLDTGIDYTHTAFKNFNVPQDKLGLTFDEVTELLKAKDFLAESLQAGLTASDVYVNDKIPFAFDYADGDSDVFPINSDHGTHVAGIIAGKDDVITGVAPNAQLIIMKTFSDTESSARSTWILSALEDCVTLGVDVINMSLGTDCGFSRASDKLNENKLYDKIKAAGISLVVAASNSYNSTFGSEKNGNLGLTSNPDSATVGSPSTYDAAFSIASISGVKTPYLLFGDTIIYYTESSDRVAEEKEFLLDVLGKDKTEAEIEIVVIPGVGRVSDYTGLDVKDKLVLVRRGDSTFEEKANIAQAQGALGIIVYNNVSGDIKMNVGEATFGAISISQTDGEFIAGKGGGIVKLSTSQTSGPFMSDFSSWGPTPSLGIKPELTAHGGSILSAVPGQDYDRISGTSMATPNTSGVVILMRQYVKENFLEIADDDVKVAAFVNCLLMSTADIVYNKNGLPYAVRKQGAGLGNLINASKTQAYIVTKDKDGNAMDKTKFELGDDVEKTGVYTLTFDVNNFGTKDITYDLEMIVMTEGVSETKTSHGQTTVTEEGYMLSPTIKLDGVVCDSAKTCGSITVKAGQAKSVTVQIVLSDADKEYLDKSFENGMYVEGFLVLNNKDEKDVSLSAPFLAFYGDWSKAPIFDLDYFATNKDELDDGIDFEDKTLPDAYATRPIGAVEGDYVNYMGSFYFDQNPSETPIAADRKYISISNQTGSVHSLEYIWAGLLRNCAKVHIVITEDSTGEIVFETWDYEVRKSYSNGQTIYPANIDVGFDAMEQNLKNNTKYNVTVKTYLDYEKNDGSETNNNNTFSFPLVTDFEAPAVTGVEYYTEYDKSAKKTRLYAKIAVYDNHYAMGMQIGYVGMTKDATTGQPSLILEAFDQYVNAIYSEYNTTNYITYELTDYIEQIKENAYHKNTFTVAVYDYALNQATYEIGLPDDYTDFYFDFGIDDEGNVINTLALSPNQTYTLDPKVYPTTEWTQLLKYVSDDESVARVVNNTLVAVGPGETTIRAQVIKQKDDPINDPDVVLKEATFTLTVHSEYLIDNDEDGDGEDTAGDYILTDEGEYKKYSILNAEDKTKYENAQRYSKNKEFKKVSKPVVDNFYINGYYVNKAYYFLSSVDRDIGETGNEMKFGSTDYYALEMFPSESVTIRYILDAYFPDDTTVEFKSSNDKIVAVDENGRITAKAEGVSSITIKVLQDGKSTYYSQTISITVKDPYVTSGPMLANYFGNGGYVTIPDDLDVTEIGQFAFSNYTYVPKQEWEIDPNTNENYKFWFVGDNTITTVVIPEGVEKIGPFAFANLTALEEVVLPSTLKMIDQGAFYGCTSLKRVKGIENVKFINQNAFYNCALEGTLNLESAAAVGNYAFASGPMAYYYENEETGEAYWTTIGGGTGNQFTSVILSEKTQSIGAYAFASCKKLEGVTIKAEMVQLSMGAFAECTALKSIEINAPVIPTGAFDGCTALSSVTLGKDVKELGEYAFSNTALKSFIVAEGNEAFKAQEGKPYLLNKEGNTLVLFASGVAGSYTVSDTAVKTVAKGAFSGCTKLTEISIPSVTAVKDYAFAGCKSLGKITLGELTEIGAYAFHRTSITSTHKLNKVEKIGDYAYAETQILQVEIPNDKIVGVGAFQDCTRLMIVKVGDNVTLGASAFRTNNLKQEGVNYDLVKKDVDGKEIYFYEYYSSLISITIGKNVTIGNGAFYGAVSVESITLGEGAKIGPYAFYNANSLSAIDLSKVVSIGNDAFSGDVMYQFVEQKDEYGQTALVPRVDKNGAYIYSYFTPNLVSINLISLEKLGERAFSFCQDLEQVVLGESIKEVPARAFASCDKLEAVNLNLLETIGEEAFAETAIINVITSATSIGKYAFVYCEDLRLVSLSNEQTKIYEGAFSYCSGLFETNLANASYIDAYAFAYTKITLLDLSNVTYIGDLAFLKESPTVISELKLSEKLEDIGENPFAMCIIKPLKTTTKETFNGIEYEKDAYTFELSEKVHIIDGNIFRVVPKGYELITYTGTADTYEIPMETVRISAYAFAGNEIQRVVLPRTVSAIGHKAFYGCDKLLLVVFTSYDAPVLEEEFDNAYFSSYEHFPSTGEYTDFTDHDGNVVIINGIEIVDYFMYNVASFPTNVYYGANFIDYVGYVDNKIIMTRPANGRNYDSFIFSQYFGIVIDGENAPNQATLNAINAILSLPNKDDIKLSDKALVESARNAYSQVASTTQQGIIIDGGYYDILVGAEKKIENLEYLQNQGGSDDTDTDTDVTPPENEPTEEPKKNTGKTVAIVILVALAALAVAGYMVPVFMKLIPSIKAKKIAKQDVAPVEKASEPENTEADDASNNE